MNPKDRLFVALDSSDLEATRDLVRAISPHVGGLKVGKELFTAFGPEGVGELGRELPLFLDLKFHDIPATVAGAVRAACRLAPAFLNVHASGGAAMLQAAVEARDEAAEALGIDRPGLLAVTVLTSLDDDDLAEVGQLGPVAAQVSRLAMLSRRCGLDGVVASPREATQIRRLAGPDFRLMVPGIRPRAEASADQKRVMTPGEAIEAGIDYLVVGRPVTRASDPARAAEAIVAEIASRTDQATAS